MKVDTPNKVHSTQSIVDKFLAGDAVVVREKLCLEMWLYYVTLSKANVCTQSFIF